MAMRAACQDCILARAERFAHPGWSVCLLGGALDPDRYGISHIERVHSIEPIPDSGLLFRHLS